jgi:hypothetical protein
MKQTAALFKRIYHTNSSCYLSYYPSRISEESLQEQIWTANCLRLDRPSMDIFNARCAGTVRRHIPRTNIQRGEEIPRWMIVCTTGDSYMIVAPL